LKPSLNKITKLLKNAGTASGSCRVLPDMSSQFRTTLETHGQKLADMRTKNLFTVAVVSGGLAFSVAAQAKEREHEEQTISSSDVPATVQQAA
jgi:hypothetical protein